MPNADPLISAVICTRNRAPLLRRAVESLLRQQMPVSEYEILVIDNDSTDETAQMISDNFGEQARLRYLNESRSGLVCARNRGWREARGNYVAYLDDDAEADPAWLSTILRAFHSMAVEPGAVGGKINLIWPIPAPPWLTDGNLQALGHHDFAPVSVASKDPEAIFGANAAYSKAALEATGGFDPNLGRIGGTLRSGEEIDLNARIIGHGFALIYDPAIAVGHYVHPNRLNRRWHLKRGYWQGVSSAVSDIGVRQMGNWKRIGIALAQSRYLFMPPVRTILFSREKRQKLYIWSRLYLHRLGYITGLLGLNPLIERLIR